MDDRNADSKPQSSSKPQPQPKPQPKPAGGPKPDSTDYGQPAGSPGTRGGTTCYGGVHRAPDRGSKPGE